MGFKLMVDILLMSFPLHRCRVFSLLWLIKVFVVGYLFRCLVVFRLIGVLLLDWTDIGDWLFEIRSRNTMLRRNTVTRRHQDSFICS